MLYVRAVCFWTVLVFLCSGCIVQSFNPHYTKGSLVPLPGVAGKWQLVKDRGRDLEAENKEAEEKGEKRIIINPWTITFTGDQAYPSYGVQSHDTENRLGFLKATFFAVAGETYCDATPIVPTKEASFYLYNNVYTVHVLFKVELKDDVLRLRFLNREWMEKALKAKDVTFPIIQKQRTLLLNATADEWKTFLEKYGKTDGVFSDKNPMELRRIKDDAPAAEKKDPPKAEPEEKKEF